MSVLEHSYKVHLIACVVVMNVRPWAYLQGTFDSLSTYNKSRTRPLLKGTFKRKNLRIRYYVADLKRKDKHCESLLSLTPRLAAEQIFHIS